jgi:hypothetical protein
MGLFSWLLGEDDSGGSAHEHYWCEYGSDDRGNDQMIEWDSRTGFGRVHTCVDGRWS